MIKNIYSLLVGLLIGLAGLFFGYQQKSKRLAQENEAVKKARDVQSDINEAYIDGEIRAEKERAEALEAARDGKRDHFE